MFICLLTGEYPPAVGGLADYTALLERYLAAEGHSVAVVTARPSSVDKLGVDEVRTVSSWRSDAAGEWAEQIAQADVVHLQYQAAAYGMSPAVNLLPALLRRQGIRAPIVTTFHDLRVPYLFRGAGPLRALANHFLIGASDACIFTDPTDLARARPRRRAAWIPIGPNVAPGEPTDRAAERARHGIAPNEAVVAHFGFANASKGLDVLLRAAQRLVRAGVPLRLLFVGHELGTADPTNNTTAAGIRALAAALGVDDRIIRTGPLPARAVSAALATADVAALPFADGASLRRGSLLACLTHGLPVVTTEPPPIPDVPRRYRVAPFEDMATFRIDATVVAMVPVGDDAALARELYRLLNDPTRLQELGRSGEIFAQRFDWPAIARATVAVYAELLDGR